MFGALLKLLGLKKDKSAPEKVDSTPMPNPQPAPPPQKPEQSLEDFYRYGDPEVSDPKANIGSFLWKPESDHAPHNPVVIVACDDVRNDELTCRITSAKGRTIEVLSGSPTGRANHKPPYKFGRIHFRPTKSAKVYKKRAPLTVTFELKDGTRIKVLKRVKQIIKDPTKRIDK